MRVPPRTPATRRTAVATRFESPLRDYPAPPVRQHPERLPLGDSVRQRTQRRWLPHGTTAQAVQRLPHMNAAAAQARPPAAVHSKLCGSKPRGAFWGCCFSWGKGGGGPQNRGEGGRWPLAGDTDFENSHKNIAHNFCARTRVKSVRANPWSRTNHAKATPRPSGDF